MRLLLRLNSSAGDVLLAVGLTVVTLLLGHESHVGAWRHSDALDYALICLANLPIAARRRAPVTVLLICWTFWVWHITAGYWPAMNGLGTFLALYTVAARRTFRLSLFGSVLIGAAWIYGETLSGQGSMWSVVAQALVLPALTWRVGNSARRLADSNRDLAELTGQLRREQAENARRAVIEERMRLARELHDVVAHHMSVVSVQAGMAEYVVAGDPKTATQALRTIGSSSRAAQDELRRLLLLLRTTAEDGDTAAAPSPGLDRLDELADRMRAAGVPVEITVTGRRCPVPPGIDLCAYRVIQESLTNALKHAGPASVQIALHYGRDDLVATVRDDGAGGHGGPVPPGSGHGLIGMRERAGLYGGTVAAGPRPDRGFEVALTLPMR